MKKAVEVDGLAAEEAGHLVGDGLIAAWPGQGVHRAHEADGVPAEAALTQAFGEGGQAGVGVGHAVAQVGGQCGSHLGHAQGGGARQVMHDVAVLVGLADRERGDGGGVAGVQEGGLAVAGGNEQLAVIGDVDAVGLRRGGAGSA